MTKKAGGDSIVDVRNIGLRRGIKALRDISRVVGIKMIFAKKLFCIDMVDGAMTIF